MEQVYAEILNLMLVSITVFAGFVTKQVISYLNKKGVIAKLQGNKELVKIVVQAVEQAYKHLEGKEKLNMAKIELIKLMNEKKIKISDKEIDILIESSVREMNEAIKKELKK